MQVPCDKVILFYDGDCGFCNSWVNFILKWDTKMIFYFSSLHSDLGVKMRGDFKILDEVDSIIFLNNGKSSIKAKAVLEICNLLGYPLKALNVLKLIPLKWMNLGYDFVGKYRHLLLKNKKCTISLNYTHRFLD